MTTASRDEPAQQASAPKTLADVAAWLAKTTTITPRKKADFTSAQATYAKLLGKPYHHIRANVAEIRRTIDGWSPAQCGMKTASYRNFKSRMLKLLAAAGCRVVPGRHAAEAYRAKYGSK